MNISKLEVPFTQIANSVLNDKSLSLSAKGLFAYIYSKPDNWDFSYKRIAQDQKEGEKSVLSTLKELELAGYLKREKLNTGRVNYYLSHISSEPSSQTPKLAVRLPAEIGTISNKDIIVIKSNSNKEKVDKYILLFKEVLELETVATWYKNKTLRESIIVLDKDFGFDRVEKRLRGLQKYKDDTYCPKVMTPYDLLHKWDNITKYVESKVGKQKQSNFLE